MPKKRVGPGTLWPQFPAAPVSRLPISHTPRRALLRSSKMLGNGRVVAVLQTRNCRIHDRRQLLRRRIVGLAPRSSDASHSANTVPTSSIRPPGGQRSPPRHSSALSAPNFVLKSFSEAPVTGARRDKEAAEPRDPRPQTSNGPAARFAVHRASHWELRPYRMQHCRRRQPPLVTERPIRRRVTSSPSPSTSTACALECAALCSS